MSRELELVGGPHDGRRVLFEVDQLPGQIWLQDAPEGEDDPVSYSLIWSRRFKHIYTRVGKVYRAGSSNKR